MVFRKYRDKDKSVERAVKRGAGEIIFYLGLSGAIKAFQMAGGETAKYSPNVNYSAISPIFSVGTDVAFYSMLGLSAYTLIEMYKSARNPREDSGKSDEVKPC